MLAKTKYKNLSKYIILLFVLAIIFILSIDSYVNYTGQQYIRGTNSLEKVDAIIVLGAYVHPDGSLSNMLEDRVKSSIDIYNKGYSNKILVSGDHGHESYDEVNNMRKYLEENNIPKENIFMDHAGFNTYDSIYRAKKIFKINKAIIITQKYHLVRALYIAKNLDIEALGIASDLRTYPGSRYYRLRDVLSRLKSFIYILLKPEPKYLGDEIPISGDGRSTHDLD